MNPNDFLRTAKEAALAAGEVAREKFYQPLQISNKGYRDYVTDADLAAQETITRLIRKAYPDHGFLTEEADSSLPADGPVRWIIDPIDGTTNYSHSVPLFCVSIAAVLNRPPFGVQEVLAAVIYDPMLDEMFSAVVDGDNQLNGRPLQASRTTDLAPAVIATDWNRNGKLRQTTLDTVGRLVHDVDTVSIFNSAALALAWVAAGRLDAYFNFQLMPWDVAAAGLLIREAGGVLSDIAGNPISLAGRRLACLASNGSLHDTLISYMPPVL